MEITNLKSIKQVFTKNLKNGTQTIKFGNKPDTFEKEVKSEKSSNNEFDILNQINKYSEMIKPEALLQKQKNDNNLPYEIGLQFFANGTNSKPEFNKKRYKELTELGVNSQTAKTIAELDEVQYKHALELMANGSRNDNITEYTKLDDTQYKKVLELLKNGASNYFLEFDNLLKLDDEQYKKALELLKNNVDTSAVAVITKLDDKQSKKALDLWKKGVPSHLIENLITLNDAQLKKVPDIINNYYELREEACEYPYTYLNLDMPNAYYDEVKDEAYSFFSIYDTDLIKLHTAFDPETMEDLLKTHISDLTDCLDTVHNNFTPNDIELLDNLCSCRDIKGRSLKTEQKIKFIDLINTFKQNYSDTSILQSMTETGKIDTNELTIMLKLCKSFSDITR